MVFNIKYLPFENLTYRTNLDYEEVLLRINAVVHPKKTYRVTGLFGRHTGKPYEGEVSGNKFKINRIINYRNSFLPQIYGEISKQKNGTLIKLRMKLHALVLFFTIILCGVTGVIFLAQLIEIFTVGGFSLSLFGTLAMFLFVYLLTTLGFKYESSKSKKYFALLLEAEIEKPSKF